MLRGSLKRVYKNLCIYKDSQNKFSKFVIPLLIIRYVTLNVSSATTSNTLLFSIDQYLNTSENSSDQNLYYDLNQNFKLQGGQSAKVEINLNWSQNENYLYTHVSNLFYEFEGSKFSLGFKKIEWSKTLDFFQSSEWQQQLERNKLRPKTGGNLGIFYNFDVRNLKVDIMYSPYFIPTRGPDVDFKNGAAVSQNPWFLKPPQDVPFKGDTFSTNYKLEDPNLADLLAEQTLAFKVNALEGKNWTLNLAYANKPSPKLVTDLDFTANIADPDVPIDVIIKSRAVRHELMSGDLSYLISQRTKATFGYLNENFASQSLNSKSETYMQPLDQNNFTFLISHTNEKYRLSVGGIYRNGGRSKSLGELASALVNQNINYIYEQAVKLDFTYFKAFSWTLNTSFSYDFLQKGFLTSATLQRQFSKSVINIGFDAIEPLDTSDQSSFVYQYRNLDRIWAGLSYVF